MAGTNRAFEAQMAAARPQALGALSRYFCDLDAAEEAFQEACLRALRTWPDKGLPSNPTAWLIRVGRNFGIDESRRQKRHTEMPTEQAISQTEDAETPRLESMDNEQYRDDVLRLLFICCHPDLPTAQQIAVALKIVAGMSVPEIARAFLVAPKAMEQRITRAKRQIAKAQVPFAPPTKAERSQRLETVATMVYLLFNEGYSASGGNAQVRVPLCQEAIRLARLLLRLFPGEAEIMGLLALCLLQHSRSQARLDITGNIILLEDQDRSVWDQQLIAEGGVLIEKALRQGHPGKLQLQAAIAAVHAQANTAAATNWPEIDRLYAVLEQLDSSPVVTLNRAVAIAKSRGPAAALETLEPLATPLAKYFHFHGVRAALLADLELSAEAIVSFKRALELAGTPAETEHIRQRLKDLEESR